MSLQEITNKIKVEAETEAGLIIAKANEEVSIINEKTRKQVADIEAETEAGLNKAKLQRESVVTSLGKQKTSLAKQEVKRRLLDMVYDEAFGQLVNLPAEDYVSILTKKYSQIISSDVALSHILAPKNRLSETETIAKNLGWSAEIKSDDKLKGGCVLVGENFEFNLSLEKMFAEDRLSSETEIAGILFSGSK